MAWRDDKWMLANISFRAGQDSMESECLAAIEALEARVKELEVGMGKIASQRAGGDCYGPEDPNNYNALRNEAIMIARSLIRKPE